MNKMLVARFNSEPDAYKGLDALKRLHRKGDISLYATAVITKEPNGKVNVKQAADSGPVGTVVGILTGGALGLVGGVAGAAVGATLGSLTGLLFDAENLGVNTNFLDEVSEVLAPGKSVVIAELDEEWVTPVDVELKKIGGQVFRRPRYEVIEDQLASESKALEEEVKELQEEIKEANAEAKAAVKKTLDSVKMRIKSNAAKAQAKLDQINKENKAKIEALQVQMKDANDQRKAKIEKRIANIKDDQKRRSKKLQQAIKLAQEALKP